MGRNTFIQWCDDTVNATSGCDGCELKTKGREGTCYAVPIHTGRLANAFPDHYSPDFHEIRLIPGRMEKAAKASGMVGKPRPEKPWLNGLPRIIFIGDLGDLFSKDVPFEYIQDEVFRAITSPSGCRHLWMILTKQPKRLAAFARCYTDHHRWPANVLSGTSVTTQASTTRVRDLMAVPGHKFVSVEPMWEAIDLWPYLGFQHEDELETENTDQSLPREQGVPFHDPWIRGLDLVICGGESRQSSQACHPFDVAWARSLRDQCHAAGVAFFMKQFGASPRESFVSGDPADIESYGGRLLDLRDSHGGDWDEWPEDLRVRQFPRIFPEAP